MFDETAEDLAELTAQYHEQHQPSNPTERELVDTLIHNEWRLRRMCRVEAVLWEHAANAYLTLLNILKSKPAIPRTPSSRSGARPCPAQFATRR